MARRSNAKGVAWVGLVIALIALIFSWIAFTRTGTQLNDTIEQAVEKQLETSFQTQQDPSANSTNTTPTATSSEGETQATTSTDA
ncbi:MAG: hypothetical protein BRC25_02305 [Parcubacteria group bacterium SW_6_46_9]|nr:MAG: hypothetical protein BRC25_02305 [Parcubacteria group bacterium SW_6_46_9]